MIPPRATYRLQLGPKLDFEAAAQLADYLAELGVSHVYASPVLEAVPGSTHGYDVVDPTRIRAELGGPSGLRTLSQALREHGLGLLLDVVPNHMATHLPENRWWWDVLENGPASHMARFFDVDWCAAERKLAYRILLPILGAQYGEELARGELQLERAKGALVLRVGDQTLPIAPRSLDGLLRDAAERSESQLLEFLAHAHGSLPLATEADAELLERRHRHKEVLRGLLARLCEEEPRAARAIDAAVARWNRDPDLLHALLERQNYRLAHWRTAARELPYRSFVDVAELAALRMEDPRVFAETHAAILRLITAGVCDGMRIDHVDGLRDPRGYLDWVAAAGPGAWVVVEKILAAGESLPSDWPVAGTTGYDFLWRSTGVFVDPAGEAPLAALYAELTGDSRSWSEAVRHGKKHVLHELLASDLERIVDLAVQICESHRAYRDFTRGDLQRALAEIALAWPVYRSYSRAGDTLIDPATDAALSHALGEARAHAPGLDGQLFEFLDAILRRRLRGPLETELVLRLQQLTPAVTAKGVEDTAGYAYPRLAALCDVGCDPGAFAVSVGELHAANAEAQQRWPRALLATSTHDTKRSEDVRARLVLLSEISERWAAAVRGWFARAARHRSPAGPDPKLEYLLYQTLVGAWPIARERMLAYAQKAAREAKEHTSWLAPARDYEEALAAFVERLFRDETLMDEIAAFAGELEEAGRMNSLGMTLLKLTCPGVPDFYQGSEVWDGSLVDPDNRRPVDFDRRRGLLDVARSATAEQALADADSGLAKLFVTERVLHERRRHPERFDERSHYAPIAARGAHSDRVIAFERAGLVCVVSRFGLSRCGDWGDTRIDLPPGRHRDVFTEQSYGAGPEPVSRLLARFPVALLSLKEFP